MKRYVCQCGEWPCRVRRFVRNVATTMAGLLGFGWNRF